MVCSYAPESNGLTSVGPLHSAPLDEQGRPSGGPLNRHAGIWLKSREWLQDEAGAAVLDLNALQADKAWSQAKRVA